MTVSEVSFSSKVFAHLCIFSAPGLKEKLRHAFTLRPEFLEPAKKMAASVINDHEKKLAKRRKKKSKKKAKKKNWILVGIHSRRTDHISYEKEKGIEPLKPSYYLQAMDLYR